MSLAPALSILIPVRNEGINLKIEPFTLVGATTRYAMLSAPLRDRFGSVYRLENGTAIADTQAILALLENHQRADGRVDVPGKLRPYVGKDVIGG